MSVHEWALAESIILYLQRLRAMGRNVKKLVIGLGELQSIDEEVLSFALRELAKSSGLEDVEIELRKIEAVLRCRSCGYEMKLSDLGLDEGVREAIHFVPEVVHAYVSCPRCGSRDIEIVSGRGIEVLDVEYG